MTNRQPPPINVEDIPNNDESAQKEDEAISRQDLEIAKERALSEHKRAELLRKVVGIGAASLVSSVLLLALVSLGVISWHYLTPEDWWWVNQNRLDEIRSLVVGLLFGYLAIYLHDRL